MSFAVRVQRPGNQLSFDKPAHLAAKTFLFRPQRVLSSRYSVALTLERGNASANSRNPATFTWCGSRSLIGFSDAMSGFVTNLRFPDEQNPGDVYALTIGGYVPLRISLSVQGEAESGENGVAVEALDDAGPVGTICLNPATTSQQRWTDHLVTGACYMAANQHYARYHIVALRDFPDGAGLRLAFRPVGKPDRNQLIRVAAGEMTRLAIIAKGADSSGLYFWLHPASAGDRWPLILKGEHQFEWTGSVQRRWDTNFLPAFSLEEPEPAGA